jgi:hypothetical protein
MFLVFVTMISFDLYGSIQQKRGAIAHLIDNKTPHGKQRALQRGFSERDLAAIRGVPSTIKRQPNGRTVYIQAADRGQFKVLVENRAGQMITVINAANQRELDRLAHNYSWR